MKNLFWITALLAVAVVLLSVRVAFDVNCDRRETSKEKENTEQNMEKENSTLECIMTRASVRKFTSEKVTDSEIETLLKAGMAAPTAMDKRPWFFYVVTDEKIRKEIAEKMPNASYAATAPLAIVVCGDMSKAIEGAGQTYWIQDCSAVTENILLAAHAMGLGAVWCGITPIKERMEITKTMLDMPDNLEPLDVIIIGHPEVTPTPKDKWDPENIKYIR